MFLWGDQYLAQRREPLTWIIQDLIPVGGKANLFGRPKAKKSFLALQMASAISSGAKDFLGFPILKNGPVAYIQIDTSASVWWERAKNLAALGHSFQNVAFADTETGTPFPLNVHTHAPEIKAHITKIKPVLVIWDTIREAHPGDENESAVMKNVMSAMVDCARGPLDSAGIPEWQAATLVISHRKKDNPNYSEDLVNANRGSSYIAGAVDCILQLSTTDLEFVSRATEQTRMKVNFDEDQLKWVVGENEDKILRTIATVLVNMPTASGREQAKTIAEICGITEESARGHLRRKKARVLPRLVAISS